MSTATDLSILNKPEHSAKRILYILTDIDLNRENDVSCGGVVFFFNKHHLPVFLLLKHVPGGHWDVPKGHPEKNETFKETALREIVEESGIPSNQLKLIQELNHKNQYSFRHKGKWIDKVVHLFLYESLIENIILSSEHSNFKWAPLELISEHLTYDTSLPAFKEAFNIIGNFSKLS